MEYSGLAKAIKQDNEVEINRLTKSLIPQLISYLQIQLNAGQQDAEDCAQQAFLISFEMVRNEKLEHPERIYSFLITTCRNTYLNMINRRKRSSYEDFSQTHSDQPGQLFSLLSDERQTILKQCIERLSEQYRTYIEYWFTHPDSHAKAVALHFGISVNNAWTRKHRIIGKLNECYQKKSAN
jgi:RNA polymerase sigma factor (sigma-70 family)